MTKTAGIPMFIYISGPHSPNSGENDPAQKAKEVAIELVKKGHFPLIPHTMLHGWEAGGKISREKILRVGQKWIEKCDALYFIAPSAEAESERQAAAKLNLPIYRSLDDIPDAVSDSPSTMSVEALNAQLIEYQECMESYRLTYVIIWQAGAFLSALTGIIITFAPDTIKPLSLLPIICWYLGVFIPMNRYGELRNDRLVAIEQLLNATVPGLKMAHFSSYSKARKDVTFFGRIFSLKWRVSQSIAVVGFFLIVIQLYLIWVNYLSQFFR